MKKILFFFVIGVIIYACLPKPEPVQRSTSVGASGNGSGTGGGGSGTGGGGSGTGGGGSGTGGGGSGTGGSGNENWLYLYQYGSNFIRYVPKTNVFEKSTGFARDAGRRMMTIDLFSWCIANYNRNKLIFSSYRIKDSGGNILFESYDTEGAVHVSYAQNERETNRGNNHQEAYSRFLIAEGIYTIEFHRLAGSVGVPQLYIVEQHENNTFKCLVGANPNQTVSTLDNIGVNILTTEPYITTFTVSYIEENNCFLKANANGFDS